MSLEDFDLALSDFNTCIEMDPENGDLYIGRGELFLDNEFLKAALADFNIAIDLDSGNSLTLGIAMLTSAEVIFIISKICLNSH
jgi:hypothetical protein